MKSEERLLNEVLRDEEYEEFQRELAGTMLRELRRKKNARRRPVLLAMAAAAVGIASLSVWLGEGELPRVGGPERGREVVVAPASLPEAPGGLIVRSTANVEVVRSSAEIEVVRTPNDKVEVIGDGELLAMFRDEAGALVGNEPRERRFIRIGGEW